MRNSREIKTRIKSVKNISKVTKTMELISASRMKTANKKLEETLPYANILKQVFMQLRSTDINKWQDHPYIKAPAKVKKICVVLIGPTRGYVGNLLSSQVMDVKINIENLKKEFPQASFAGVTVNRLALKMARYAGFDSEYHFGDIRQFPTNIELFPVCEVVRNSFLSKEFDLVYLSYINKKPIFKRILPVDLEAVFNDTQAADDTSTELYEPSAALVANYVLNEYFENQIYQGLLTSSQAEHTARMISMKNASDNAKSLGGALQLNYNKSRQAQITEEIIEVTR